ncbi:autotransporter outer membrane beta-barrel domain-containing protein [Bartonella sp. CB175]|uniref:autotransporter outer membrane beta-barrel domain-containing protein n=1 Tax=Bartonella sp. CB175 TaxID=3112256 RepID=UPI00300DC59F
MKKHILLCTVSGIIFCSYSSLSYAITVNDTIAPSKTDYRSYKDYTFTDPAAALKADRSLLKSVSQKSKNNKSVREPEKVSTTVPSPFSTETSDSYYTYKPWNNDAGSSNDRSAILSEKPEGTTQETGGAKSRRRQLPSLTESSSIEKLPSLDNLSANPNKQPPVPSKPSARPEQQSPVAGNPGARSEQQPPVPRKPADSVQVVDSQYQSAIDVRDGTVVTRNNVKINDRISAVNAHGKGSVVKIMEGDITSDFIALSANNGGTIDGTDLTVKAVTVGLLNTGGTIKLNNSTVTVTGDHEAYGIAFEKNSFAYRNPNIGNDADNHPILGNIPNTVILTNTTVSVPNGIGIYAPQQTINTIKLMNSKISGDILAKSDEGNKKFPHSLVLVADSSFLEGQTKMLGESGIFFDLNHNTRWFLKTNNNPKLNDYGRSDHLLLGVNERSYSSLFALSLSDSSIVFDKPTDGIYQTLHVGFNTLHPDLRQENGDPMIAYNAQGKAEIYLHSQLSHNLPIDKQKTDRLLFSGSVSGKTIVHVDLSQDKGTTNSDFVWEKAMASIPIARHGISLIQVNGKAEKDSFRLPGDYTTMSGSPYKYILRAYEPGKSDVSQNLLNVNNDGFWDFRLQNEYVDGDKNVRALLPQVANYLVMPGALFSAGFSDINNKNVLIDTIRIKMFESEDKKSKGIFVSSYGNKLTLSSSRDPKQYGYDADVNYKAIQVGTVLAALEGTDITTDFGLLGTYGKLTFTPKGMKDSEKTMLDKWSITAYSGLKHSNGLYVNAFLSYGTLKGDITAPLIKGKTELKGTGMLSASATIGQKLETNIKELVFEPQAQLAYQNLMFKTLSDAEGFEVDMKNPHQWLIRVGGRLTRSVLIAEEGRSVSFYGKLNVLRAFGDGKTIRIGDTFHTDSIGSSIEGGIGVNAYLSQNVAFYGDVSYQHKLQKAGVSGTNLSGGIRYHF